MDESVFHHEFIDQTTVHPIGLTVLIFLGIAQLLLPKRYAVWPMIILACFIAPAQRVIIFGMNFDFLRLAVLVGWVRVLLRGEAHGLVWMKLDIVMTAWTIVKAAVYTLQNGSGQALVNALGNGFDALGMYFLFRFLITQWEDLYRLTLGFATCSVLVAICFLIESSTARNLFAFLGGVPEVTMVREGKLRCQGAFAHPIIAGCFWAALMPLMGAGLWRRGMGKLMMFIGLGCSGLIVVLCASSTPALSVMLGLGAAFLFPLRGSMRVVRWTVLITAVGLHLAMRAPIWHLIARIDISGGSTGWHRFRLIDEAINRLGEWWLTGVSSTAGWGQGLVDVTNQFILEGVRGGLLAMILFIAIVSLAFGNVGVMLRAAGNDRWKLATAWAVGVSMFVHVASFFAVSYFGQINMVWFQHLAITGMAGGLLARSVRASVPVAVTRKPRRVRHVASIVRPATVEDCSVPS